MPKLKNLVIDEKEVMNGFCWAYCHSLLEKALELDCEDKIFAQGAKLAWEFQEQYSTSDLTEIAYSVLIAISKQINGPGVVFAMTPGDVGKLISVCQEFLDIFKEKKPCTKLQQTADDTGME
jgi:hypothetical protein